MLGYIPSPSANGFNIGPLRLHVYGFLIVCGVFAAVWLADRRWRARGGEPGTFSNLAVWAVPAGLVGARLYSVFTDYELYDHHPLNALKIWQGGLGIWGGIAGGALGAWLYVRRHHMDFLAVADTVAPALPLAQALGRWGNYFNQELFGRPTSLPWGLKINPSIVANLFSNVNKPVPQAYLNAKAFQPTFLYECIWDLCVVGIVLYAEKHLRLRKGYLFWVYVSAYTFGRFFTEYLRIDFAHKFLGLRFNDWVSIIVFAVATILVLTRGRIRDASPPVAAPAGDDADALADAAADDPSLARVAVSSGSTGSTGSSSGAGAEANDVVGYSSSPPTPIDADEPVAPPEPPPGAAGAGPAVAAESTPEPESPPAAAPEPAPPVVAEPEIPVVAAPEPEPEIPVAAALEPPSEPEPEAAAEPEPPTPAEPEPATPAEPEPAPEPEPPAAAEPEPPVAAEPEPPVAAEPEPPAQPEPAPEPEPPAEPPPPAGAGTSPPETPET